MAARERWLTSGGAPGGGWHDRRDSHLRADLVPRGGRTDRFPPPVRAHEEDHSNLFEPHPWASRPLSAPRLAAGPVDRFGAARTLVFPGSARRDCAGTLAAGAAIGVPRPPDGTRVLDLGARRAPPALPHARQSAGTPGVVSAEKESALRASPACQEQLRHRRELDRPRAGHLSRALTQARLTATRASRGTRSWASVRS